MAYVVISFFATDTYDDPDKPKRTTSYSHFDPALRAEGSTYFLYRIYALICVATHVFGIPAFFAFSLYRVRNCLDPVDSNGCRPRLDPQKFAESRAQCAAIAETRINNPKLRALRPLWFVYVPEYFYFEVFELLRRMVMMALPNLVSRQPVTQTAFTFLIAYVSTRLYREIQPFISASDCEFFENTQWLTLILTSILFYIAADQRRGLLAGYAIIVVFMTSIIHATILVARDMRQEKFIADAMKVYMSKMGDSFNSCRLTATPNRHSFVGGLVQGSPDDADDPTLSDAVKDPDDCDDDASESHRPVAEHRSPSKVANSAEDEANRTSFDRAQSISPSYLVGRECSHST